MKKIFNLLVAGFFTVSSFAQTNIPQLVSFSAIVRDASNIPMVNTSVSIRLTFKEGGQNGSLVYCALHQITTNQNGFMSLQLNRDVLGTGCNGAPSTAFENIPWDNGDFWMEVEYQTTPTSPFVSLGQLELASSFYAFAAGTAERLVGFDLNGANDGDVLTYNITTNQWEPIPPSNGGNNFSGNYSDLSNAPTNVSDFANDAGYVSTLNDDDPTNEIQQISVSQTGDTLHLQNGGFVIIPGISVANGGSLVVGTYPPGNVHCNGIPTEVVDVINPNTGKTWMDRNLGASRVATDSTDSLSYGDLYQWGRGMDGHQCRNSVNNTTLSSIDKPNHGEYITPTTYPTSDWRSPENDNLWQGVNGINNPCPSGYRLPTNSELEAEQLSWSSNNSTGAFNSPLKLTLAGFRRYSGSIFDTENFAFYWTSTFSTDNDSNSQMLRFSSSDATMMEMERSFGLSVRCIKN